MFDGWCDEAYNKVFEKNEALDTIQMSNGKLAIVNNDLYDKCDKLSKEILLNENRWDFLLKIQVNMTNTKWPFQQTLYPIFHPFQNYYYLLMDASWRGENDWIHRDSENRLMQPLVAIHSCPKRYLRTKSECSADAVRTYFEHEIEPKLGQMKSIVPNAEMMSKNLNVLLRKSFVSLEQHNKTIWSYKAIQEFHDQMTHDVRFPSINRFNVYLLMIIIFLSNSR